MPPRPSLPASLCIAFLTLILTLAPPSLWADVVLVDTEAGVAPAPIYLYPGAPPRTRDAAVTLADYLEKICGARPELIESAPTSLPERALWVGYQPGLEKVFPGLDFDFQFPEETLIAANERYLVIAGRDRWDPDHMEARGRLADITGRQQEYGTANAVYTFLQDQLGVRWLWPGEKGEDVPEARRLAFAPFEQRYHPQIRARSGMLVRLSLGDTKEGPDELWARYQRVQLDSLELDGGHGFGDWWDLYHETHPDYFALQPDGTRSGFPGGHNAKLCETNPAVWEQWLENVAERRKADPTLHVFNVSENDSWASGFCVCEKCQAWDNPDAETGTFHWKGVTEDRPVLSDRQVTFANHLARMLKERFPGQDLYVQLHAYGFSRPAPVAAVPDDNVIISSVSNFHLRGDGVGDDRTLAMKQFGDWGEKASLLAWRPNLGSAAGHGWGLPDVAMTQAAEDLRFVADRHCMGLFFDMLWLHWSTQGPHYYALAHLAWNPYTDVEALMDDYYQRGFGPAAAEVKAYWRLWEKARTDFVAEARNRQRIYGSPQTYTPELLGQAQALLEAANAKLDAAGAPPKYRDRVAFVQCGLDYSRMVLDTRRWMQTYESSKGKEKQAAAAEVLANWKMAAKMKATFPEFAINWVYVFNQPNSKRMLGLHPKYPLSGRTKRESEETVDGDGLE